MDWNLHLGNRVKANNWSGILYRVELDSYLLIKDGDLFIPIHKAYCKPICRDLNSITKEEMKEFDKVFRCRNMQYIVGLKLNGVYLKAECFNKELCVLKGDVVFPDDYDCTVKESLWLISKGFFVGQFNDGEYILEVKEKVED